MPDLDTLLERTSRTFALSIPLLPEPTRSEVRVAYLLFRIADTFEDSTEWRPERRVAALVDFSDLLAAPKEERSQALASEWTVEAPIDHDGYVELLGETPKVVKAFTALRPAALDVVRHHVTRTSLGMADFVRLVDREGEVALDGLDTLREYCYVVAGIVGEMLTDLFLVERPGLEGVAEGLRARARHFGEGLQLTNILKDSAFDADEGRRYIGSSVKREEVFDLARRDLVAAREYTLMLQEAGAERGIVAFNALPVLLASATLDRVERDGPGSKISRYELWKIVAKMNRALDKGAPVVPSGGG